MNGLDPAGMQEMRDMIRSLVAEGRTVVLSSHLLDEVERTCDAVAIVDRGNVIRQGSDLRAARRRLGGARGRLLRPDRARRLLGDQPFARGIDVTPAGTGGHAAGGHRPAT